MSGEVPVMYGIPNCNTMKKARDWLQQHAVDYEFHDYKKKGTTPDQLKHWVSQLGWETLINKRGTSWRKLDEYIRETMSDESAISVMQDNPTIIKRPLLEYDGKLLVGFDEKQYEQELLSA